MIIARTGLSVNIVNTGTLRSFLWHNWEGSVASLWVQVYSTGKGVTREMYTFVTALYRQQRRLSVFQTSHIQSNFWITNEKPCEESSSVYGGNGLVSCS